MFKYLVAAGLTLAAHHLATLERGYEAWGGELVFLFVVPLISALREELKEDEKELSVEAKEAWNQRTEGVS